MTCGDRIREDHNKPTSDEVAALIILPESLNQAHLLERDIIIQEQDGGLRSISYWHAAYMALRYLILFPHSEQSWTAKVPLRGVEHSNRLLARRTVRPGRLLRYSVVFRDENEIDPGQSVDDPNPLTEEVEDAPDVENTPHVEEQ